MDQRIPQRNQLTDASPPIEFGPRNFEDIWRAIFGPDDPRAAGQDEALRKRLKDYCTTPPDPVDLANSARGAFASAQSRTERAGRAADRLGIAGFLVKTSICTRNGY